MALMQGLTAAAISYGFEYFSGYDVSGYRSLFAALAGIADYYGKTMVFPKLGINYGGYTDNIVGAATGGAAFAGAIYAMKGSSAEITSLFARGAFYAFASDYALSFISDHYRNQKLYMAVQSATSEVEDSLAYSTYGSTGL